MSEPHSTQKTPAGEWRSTPTHRGDVRGPMIGISADVVHPEGKPESLRAQTPMTYCRAVMEAGGVPMILPPIVGLIGAQLRVCAGVVLIGGDDPRMEPFGAVTHPKAKVVHPLRQEYDTALIRALEERGRIPTLGVCLGMQMMALVCGGKLNQYMPENVASAEEHYGDRRHQINVSEPTRGAIGRVIQDGVVTSHHRQAVEDAGTLEVVARAHDGVIEAIADTSRRFYLGVQWHPERTADATLGVGIIKALVEAAREEERMHGKNPA